MAQRCDRGNAPEHKQECQGDRDAGDCGREPGSLGSLDRSEQQVPGRTVSARPGDFHLAQRPWRVLQAAEQTDSDFSGLFPGLPDGHLGSWQVAGGWRVGDAGGREAGAPLREAAIWRVAKNRAQESCQCWRLWLIPGREVDLETLICAGENVV